MAAISLGLAMLFALAVTLAFRRWLTLLSAGDTVAAGRGLSLPFARPASMTLAAAIAALVTAWLGPVTFVGLLAPHMAVMLGARRPKRRPRREPQSPALRKIGRRISS